MEELLKKLMDQMNDRFDRLESDMNSRFNELNVRVDRLESDMNNRFNELNVRCLLYTSPSPRDRTRSRMPSSA